MTTRDKWQVCPYCNGNGKIQDFGTTTCVNEKTCHICKGYGIISTEDGCPPLYKNQEFNLRNLKIKER